MIIKLFELKNKSLVPTEHCYAITWLKDIMEEYKENEEYIKVFLYFFYMSCNKADENPYFNMNEDEKEEIILNDIDASFSIEDPLVIEGLTKVQEMYTTTISRAYRSYKRTFEKMSKFLDGIVITSGKDGNITQVNTVLKDFDKVRVSFINLGKDLESEQINKLRGNKKSSYDM